MIKHVQHFGLYLNRLALNHIAQAEVKVTVIVALTEQCVAQHSSNLAQMIFLLQPSECGTVHRFPSTSGPFILTSSLMVKCRQTMSCGMEKSVIKGSSSNAENRIVDFIVLF